LYLNVYGRQSAGIEDYRRPSELIGSNWIMIIVTHVKHWHCVEYRIITLLGRVALAAQRPIVIKLSRERFVGLSVRVSVGRSVCPVHCGKTAARIRMPFAVLGRTGPGMRQVVGFGDQSTRKGTSWANLGAPL